MMQHRSTAVALAALAFFASPSHACSPCVDVDASFAGEVLIDTVALHWESDAEDSSILYVVKRYALSDHSDQPIRVAVLPGVGNCATHRVHGVEDSPDPGTWYYVLEVRNASNTLLCSVAVNDGAGLTVE